MKQKTTKKIGKKAEDEYMAADSHGLRSSNNDNNPNLPLIVDFNFQKGKKWQKTPGSVVRSPA